MINYVDTDRDQSVPNQSRNIESNDVTNGISTDIGNPVLNI